MPTNQYNQGFLTGLLVAAFICELKAGDKQVSHNAMAIMKYRTTSELSLQFNDKLPDWIKHA